VGVREVGDGATTAGELLESWLPRLELQLVVGSELAAQAQCRA
jgi:hypothetical protein